MEFRERYNIDDLLEIMRILRSENGCVWDREQDHASIKSSMIEEAYETAEAIDLDNMDMLKEELGDVLLQVVFHARMEEEKGGFNFDDVCDGICKKMILRHPHVFGDVKVKNSAEVLDNWDKIKKQEKGQGSVKQTLSGVSKALPALMRAEKVYGKAAKAGVGYRDAEHTMRELRERVDTLGSALESGSGCDAAVGDMLFAASGLCKAIGVDAEEQLAAKCDRFIDSFEAKQEDQKA